MGRLQMDDEGLRHLVDVFYARIRADEQLGPIFNDAVHDWPDHLEKLTAFWSSVMLGSGRYKGQPVPAHKKHQSRITPALFDRWLALWARTTDELMEQGAAEALQAKAGRISESLQLALFFRLDAPRSSPEPEPDMQGSAHS
ncbi:MAG: group III truncated hemoglobin [Sphingobium sp.]